MNIQRINFQQNRGEKSKRICHHHLLLGNTHNLYVGVYLWFGWLIQSANFIIYEQGMAAKVHYVWIVIHCTLTVSILLYLMYKNRALAAACRHNPLIIPDRFFPNFHLMVTLRRGHSCCFFYWWHVVCRFWKVWSCFWRLSTHLKNAKFLF